MKEEEGGGVPWGSGIATATSPNSMPAIPLYRASGNSTNTPQVRQ
jgi:hypothetical protein